jgi:hypothetical protein
MSNFVHLNIKSKFINVDAVVRQSTANNLLKSIKDLQLDVYCPKTNMAKNIEEVAIIRGQSLNFEYSNVCINIKSLTIKKENIV